MKGNAVTLSSLIYFCLVFFIMQSICRHLDWPSSIPTRRMNKTSTKESPLSLVGDSDFNVENSSHLPKIMCNWQKCIILKNLNCQ